MDRLSRGWGRVALFVGAVALVGGIGYVDSHVPRIVFSIFYLVPVFAVSWYAGRNLGIVLAIASAAFGLVADIVSAHQPVGYAYTNSALRLVLFLVMGVLVARLRTAIDRERASSLARRDLMRTVASRAQGPLGDITARVVDLGFEIGSSEADKRQLVNEIVRASERLSRLVRQLEEAPAPVGVGGPRN